MRSNVSGSNRRRRLGAVGLAVITTVAVVVALAAYMAPPQARTQANTQNSPAASVRSDTTSMLGAAPEQKSAPRVSSRPAPSRGALKPAPVVAKADRYGRVAFRFRFDPRGRDWSKQVKWILVAGGDAGNVARQSGIEFHAQPPDGMPAGTDPWQSMRQARTLAIEDRLEGARRLEQHLKGSGLSATERGQLERTIREQRAAAKNERAEIAPDGACPAGDKPEIVGGMTLALGDRVLLGCHFKPGERVRAEISYTFTGVDVSKQTVEDLRRINAERGLREP